MTRGREAKEAMNIPGNQNGFHVPMVPGVPDLSNNMPNVPDVPIFSDHTPKVANVPMNSDNKNLLDMLKGKYNRPAYIVVLLITSLVLVAVLIMFGSYRRQSHQMLLKVALLGSYSLHLYIISNTLGLMQSPPYKIELYAIWAVLWLLIHETASSTLSKLRDTQNGMSKLLQDIFLLYLVCWVYYVHHNQSWWKGPLALVLLFSVLKCGVRLIRSALTSLHLCHSVSLETRTKVVTDFMRYEDKLSSNGEVDPVNMQGYKYLVKGEERLNMEMTHPPNKMKIEKIDDGVITIEKVFQCEEKLLKSDGGDPSGHLKDMCLSFALFRMLMRRFRGHPLYERDLPKTWKFVHRGLLSKTDTDHERAYRVIEVELSFLYDYFYSNYPVIFSDRILFLGGTVLYVIKEIVKFSAGLLIAEQLMKLNSNFEKYDSRPFFCKPNQSLMPPISMPPSMQQQMNDIQKNIDDMQKSIQDSICGEILSNLPGKNHVLGTFVVIGLFFFLQILQFLTFVFSDWTKVSLLCKFVQKPCWLRIKIFKWASEFICRHQFIKMKPWRKKIGQYDLLSSFNYNPISFFLFCACADMTKRGQKASDFIDLHPDVKRAALNPLLLDDPLLKNRQLTNGFSSLQRNKVEDLCWACELETNTHTILVWHIATTLCVMEHSLNCKDMDSGEKKPKPGIRTSSSDENDSCEEEQNRRIATSLSGYCAYLVASVPALLPDPTDTTEAVFDKTILQARELLEECATVADRYKKLREIKDSSNIIKIGAKMEIKDSSNIIKMGVEIQNQLLSLFPVERSRWKVLAEFWVELMLFLAPSDNAMAHAENLANGGEFITHLWALLTHAGIIERNSSLQHDEENQNSAS